MDSNEKQIFVKYMVGVGEVYRQEVSRERIALYWQLLSPYHWHEVKAAFEAYLVNPDNGQFFPKPADIVKWISGSTETQALLAWTKVERALSYIGPYQTVVFDDAKIHATLSDMGGWIRLETITMNELPFVAKEFQTRYQQYARRPPSSYPNKLIGKTESQNALNNLHTPEPVLIGDQDLAKKVYLGGGDNVKNISSIRKLLPQVVMGFEDHVKTDLEGRKDTIAL